MKYTLVLIYMFSRKPKKNVDQEKLSLWKFKGYYTIMCRNMVTLTQMLFF